jgi:hypothetical protein
VAPVPPLRGEFDRACARLPLNGQVGTKEQVFCRTKEHESVSIMILAE